MSFIDQLSHQAVYEIRTSKRKSINCRFVKLKNRKYVIGTNETTFSVRLIAMVKRIRAKETYEFITLLNHASRLFAVKIYVDDICNIS